VSEILVFVLLLVLTVIAIVILIMICMRLQSQVAARVRDLTTAQMQLNTRNEEFMQLQTQINNLAQRQYTTWREREVQSIREELHRTIMEQARTNFRQWQAETEADIRADAIRRSSAVIAGQINEHFIPYMGVFPYNPKDARFLGAPIDLIVFEGMSEGDLRQIIFLEVKTNSSTLSTRERRIRDAVQAGRVTWQEFRVIGG
jgi:predicted Holliday junction resolvase-like endonuclease